MMPVLFRVLDYDVYSYVFFVVLSFILGICIVAVMARKDRRRWSEIIVVLTVMILSALIGAKLFHVLLEARGHLLSDGSEASGIWSLLQDDPWHWARFSDPGYVFYGGFLVSALTTWIFIDKKGIANPLAYGDYAAFALALGIFLGRLGCFLGGCCFGSPAEHLPWAISYPEPLSTLGFVHPTQLYDASYGIWAWFALRLQYLKNRFHGATFLFFLLSYSLWRFVTEFYRGDGDRGSWLFYFSSSQLISLLLFFTSMMLFKWTNVRSSLDN
jgi:phosphatidylglycerol---prolipoprotein diacylglyceryl transferase